MRIVANYLLALVCLGVSCASAQNQEKRMEKDAVVSYKLMMPCSPNTSNISCNQTAGFSLGNTGYAGNNPTQGDNGCNPCCYSGADLDCDGIQDVPFSVENAKFYQYCNSSGVAVTITVNIDEPGTGANCNLQGAVWVGAALNSTVMDCGNPAYAQYDSNPGGAADGFTFSSITVPNGQCAFIMIDGYAGGTCANASINIACPVPLQIELGYFKGTREGSENHLQWQTISESNSDYFEVERSDDGTSFTSIGRIKAAGRSGSAINYELYDAQPLQGYNYYRLKEVDVEGSWQYYKTILLDNSKTSASPVKITNMLGQEVSDDYQGIRLIHYSDGSVVKKMQIFTY